MNKRSERGNDSRVKYITKLYAQETQHMQNIASSCPAKLKHMQLSPMEGKIIQTLLCMINANKVLELGTLVGYSAAWIAGGLSGSNPIVISVEKSLAHYEIARKNITNAKLDEVVHIINSDAIHILKYYAGDDIVQPLDMTLNYYGPKTLFDAIFIDAKKSDYIDYLPYVKKCLRPGGIIIADNTLLFDTVYEYSTTDEIKDKKLAQIWQSIHGFNAVIALDRELISIMLPTSEGLTIAMKK